MSTSSATTHFQGRTYVQVGARWIDTKVSSDVAALLRR